MLSKLQLSTCSEFTVGLLITAVLSYLSVNFNWLEAFYIPKDFSDTLPVDDLEICFARDGLDAMFNPPNVRPPNDADIIYNVSIGQKISRPIIAFLCRNGEIINETDELFLKLKDKKLNFTISSILGKNQSVNESTIDKLQHLIFCQHASNEYPIHDPRRFDSDPLYSKKICSNATCCERLSLPPIPVHGNTLIAQGLYHNFTEEAEIMPKETLIRYFEFSMTIGHKKLIKVTNAIEIIMVSPTLRWINPNSSAHFEVNEPFDLVLEIVDQDGRRIVSGLDSTLIVEVTVAYHLKYFMNTMEMEGYLYNTTVTIAGDEVITSLRNYDLVLHKRAEKGLVHFKNVRVLNAIERLYFNATLIVPRTGIRQPDEYFDVVDKCRICNKNTSCVDYYTFLLKCGEEEKSRAVIFSDSINVTAQIAARLKLIEMQTHIDPIRRMATAISHFQIQWLWVEIQDSNGRRVHSGPDANLVKRGSSKKMDHMTGQEYFEIYTNTVPNVCILDGSFHTYNGLGHFQGSVCELKQNVEFFFTTVTSRNVSLQTNKSEPFTITGNMNLAYFGCLDGAGQETDIEPLAETFARFACEDIHNGVYEEYLPLLKDFIFSIMSINTERDFFITSGALLDIMEMSEKDPGSGIQGIIGFGDNRILGVMGGLIRLYNIPIVSIVETDDEFVTNLMYYNTVKVLCWDDLIIANNLAIWLKERFWINIIVIIEKNVEFPAVFISMFIKYGVQIALRIELPSVPESTWKQNSSAFSNEMKAIRDSGLRIIFHYVTAPLQYLLYHQADKYGVACICGYQWITIEKPAKQFPWRNEHEICRGKVTCVEAMTGMILLIGSYNIQGYVYRQWFNIRSRYFHLNRVLYRGIPTTRTFVENGEMALAYDAVLLFGYALNKLLNENVTINGSMLSSAMDRVTFQGLTDKVELRVGGGRKNLSVAMIRVSTKVATGTMRDFSHAILRYIFLPCIDNEMAITTDEEISQENEELFLRKKTSKCIPIGLVDGNNDVTKLNIQYEVPLQPLPEGIRKMARKDIHAEYQLLNSSSILMHYYVSTVSEMDRDDFVVANSNIVLRNEFIISPYLCKKGCGGKRLHIWNAMNYENGKCIGSDECLCKVLGDLNPDIAESEKRRSAYSGEQCQVIMCTNCKNGFCQVPEKCTCYYGWEGTSCSVPICKKRCVHGKCVRPDHCECTMGYHGETCNILLGAAVGVTILALVMILFIFILICRWISRRKAQREALQNLDWLVEWSDVIEKQSPLETSMQVSRIYPEIPPEMSSTIFHPSNVFFPPAPSSISVGGRFPNVVEWKETTCFAKIFKRSSLDVNSVQVRMEVLQYRELNCPYLVQLIGACLTFPNVALLLEYIPKGSLSDILHSPAYNLSWDFKYSLLKDICRGMQYIHDSKIVSHGRLKSTNCLVDSRWTCKVSDFGLPSFRYDENSHIITDEDEMQNALLWTSPELLRRFITPDEVGKGTKAGDVYSFGIIVTEVCNHESPFYFELQMISKTELFNLLKDFDSTANRGIKRLLEMYNYDVSTYIRPSITRGRMPEAYAERKDVEKLIFVVTDEDPTSRPTFKETEKLLNAIHPFHGELVENLIEMLEKYTNHLEEILAEKLTEVQSEKKKTEELIYRLLPPVIVDQLKKSQHVVASKFTDISIFFSDIVGFTTIAKQSKPMEVVELLNDLYTCFDSIIEVFDVYKLETIGDAYCVTSGVPTPNERHAEELATMSLYILSAVMTFPIRHMPDIVLHIRIGMHSGSCVAGIVGNKMPRYSIFGADVVIAQQMESQGAENCIQVSEPMATLLYRTEEFSLKYRGVIEIKTVGEMKTYWLVGKQDFKKILPDFSFLETIE